MKLFTGIKELLTLEGAARKSGRYIKEYDLSIIPDGAILEDKGKVVWAGPRKDAAKAMKAKKIKKATTVKLNVECVLPAFVECHTHLIYAGDRKNEFELRNQGFSYQEIAARGGGIKYTVEQTRKASPKSLLNDAEKHAEGFLKQGVTTLEIKSGYGLSHADEIKILTVAKKIRAVRTVATYLGPHAVPKDHTADEYLKEVIQHTLPEIAKKKLAERVDMFVEEGYYNLDQAKRYYTEAKKHGLRLTGHAEQMTYSGAAAYLVGLKADCVDHLVEITPGDLEKLAKSETTAVLLPSSDFYLRIKYPPARELIDKGARVALATDFNPGTSPTQNLSFVGILARLEMKMSLSEVIAAYTVGAAHALGYGDQLGSLEPGKLCDFAALSGSWRDLFYEIGPHPVVQVVREGKPVFKTKS